MFLTLLCLKWVIWSFPHEWRVSEACLHGRFVRQNSRDQRIVFSMNVQDPHQDWRKSSLLKSDVVLE
jgi:hypothetical protein